MKLYFYYLINNNTISCDVVDAEEKQKIYRLSNERGTNIFKNTINKNEIEKINNHITLDPTVVLINRNDDLAKQIFINDMKQKREVLESILNKLKSYEEKIFMSEISIYMH